MFIRTKKIKNGLYAYKVKNSWTGKGVRQKVSGYLGKVIIPEAKLDVDFSEFIGQELEPYLAKTKVKRIILDLGAWMLHNHGFEKTKGGLRLGNVIVNLATLNFTEADKPVVIKLGQDYMCRLTMRRLLSFKSDKGEEAVGRELAKAFVNAGIAVPEKAFIEVFGKIYSQGESYIR
jgi:hypothetical protein